MDLNSRLTPNVNNEFEESSGSQALVPPLNFGRRFIEFLSLRSSPNLSEHVILKFTVDVFHEEFLIAMRGLHDQLMHHALTLLANQDLHTFNLLSLSSESFDPLDVFMRTIGEPGVKKNFFLLLQKRKLFPREKLEILLTRSDSQGFNTHGVRGVDC